MGKLLLGLLGLGQRVCPEADVLRTLGKLGCIINLLLEHLIVDQLAFGLIDLVEFLRPPVDVLASLDQACRVVGLLLERLLVSHFAFSVTRLAHVGGITVD